jgi:multidrug efflux system membrane fusion protein
MGAGRDRGQAVPVTVIAAAQKDVPIQLRAIGNVEPYSTVAVKPQVEGQLAKIHFREGDHVTAGDLLFTIDPRPFEAALQQTQANLARDLAEADNAQVDERRLSRLLSEGLAANAEFDQAHAKAASLRAAVNADRAAVERAKLQLQYCYIHSPLNGRIGRLLVHEGNVMKANDITLAVINQISPIYVTFAVPEQELPEIRRRARAEQLHVQVATAHDPAAPITGDLSFIDNTVNPATGTVLLKALFHNADEALWPGQFVDVALTLAVERNAVVVPAAAVQTGQQGPYVFVVGQDLSAAVRPVEVGHRFNEELIVEKGLQPGETVVTDGQLRLAPGMKVQVKNAAQAEPRGTPSAGT